MKESITELFAEFGWTLTELSPRFGGDANFTALKGELAMVGVLPYAPVPDRFALAKIRKHLESQ